MPLIVGLIATGLLAGIAAGIFGIGGGVVVVPLLIYFLKYPQQTANGTSLVALLAPVGILGVMEYYRAGKIGPENIKAGFIITIGMVVGAYFGARIALGLADLTLRRVFAVFLVLTAVKLWFDA